jgi:hypothetical protein
MQTQLNAPEKLDGDARHTLAPQFEDVSSVASRLAPDVAEQRLVSPVSTGHHAGRAEQPDTLAACRPALPG